MINTIITININFINVNIIINIDIKNSITDNIININVFVFFIFGKFFDTSIN